MSNNLPTTHAAGDYEKEAASVLSHWRRRALTVTLIVTLVAGIPSLVTAMIGGVEFIGLVLFIALAIYLLAATVLTHTGYNVRVWIFLLTGLYTGTISLWLSGITGMGGIFLIILPVYAFVLAGSRAGWVTAFLSFLAFTTFSLLASFTSIKWPLTGDPNSAYRWISTGAVGMMLMINAVLLLHNYTRLQVDTLKAERQASVALRLADDAILEAWANALELRDHETIGHSRRVTELTLKVAREMGLERELASIYHGALLHDIGKMGIPDSILLKPARLTQEEWQIMRRHPKYACDMLERISFLNQSLDIPRYHHERWDGSGYPDGLMGDQVPLAARIFSVVDVWDALISDRPYRKAISPADALDYIRQHAGTEFDPQVVRAFESVIKMPERNESRNI